MTLPTFSPAQDLAEGFAAHAEQWAARHTESPALQRLAYQAALQVSLATSAGHVCIDSRALEKDGPADIARALTATGVVGTPEAADFPLVLDEEGRLYLRRYFDYERRLAAALAARARTLPAGQPAAIREQLDRFFGPPGEAPDRQRLAAALALRGGLTVISGGPGTGKTYTVVAILAALLGLDAGNRIALAAPTGKAAARMIETLTGRSAALPEPIRRLLPTEAFTVHRLLGVTDTPGRFRHDAANPLPIDTLVVDEASMLDLALATKLIEAVPGGARLILLGDKDQLAAVEAGAVFAELSSNESLSAAGAAELAMLTGTPVAPGATNAAESVLPDHVIWLTESRRFNEHSGIGRLAAGIRAGSAQATLDGLVAASSSELEWIDDAEAVPGEATRQRILSGYSDYLTALRDPLPEAARLFEAFGRFRVLCAVHDGPRGVGAINALVSQRVRRLAGAAPASPWYPGRAVLIGRNDYTLRLFNGDIGLCLMGSDGQPEVLFPEAGGGFRSLSPNRLPEHQDAFAMSVHKSQGSEFGEVLLLLPERPGPVLTRELLYTGVTRAAGRLVLCASAAVLAAAILNPTERRSGLRRRLLAAR